MRKFLLTLIIVAWFIPLSAQDFAKATKITINTSGPVQYEHYTKDEPAAIVIEFKSHNVFSYWEGVMAVNKGAIKEIHTEYYPISRPNAPQALKALAFILTQKAPYNISQTDKAIIIEVENPSTTLASGEIIIPGTLASEFQKQKQEVLDKALLEAKQKLGETERTKSVEATGVQRITTAKEKIQNNQHKNKLLFLLLPVFLLGLCSYFYFGWLKRRESKPRLATLPLMQAPGLEEELQKIKQEKEQLAARLAEKENLENRLVNQEILQAQLEKLKKDLEETAAAKRIMEDRISLIEKQIEQSRDELKIKEELIRQLSSEKEALKIETAKMNTLLKKEVSLREELNNQLSAKNKELKEILSKDVQQPKKEVLSEELETPAIDLSALADKGMLLRVATAHKEEPYLFGVVKNISLQGIIVELDKELPGKPESLKLSLFEHGLLKPIVLTGRLIEQKKDEATTKVRVNIRFLSISKDKEKRINAFIKKIETLAE